MRVISGMRRGHKLYGFEGRDIRPTTDRVKESIFNLIQSCVYIPSAYVLDMFSGSGALAMEAISRGAEKCVCIDIDSDAVELIKKNALDLHFTDKCEILCMSCFDYVASCRTAFGLIFLDPPYNKGYVEKVLIALEKSQAVSDDTIIVLESDDTDFRGEIPGLAVIKQRKYGRTYITVYKRAEEETDQ